MKTKKRYFKAVLVILLIGLGVFQNINFEQISSSKNAVRFDKSTNTETIQEENQSESIVYTLKVISTSIQHLVSSF
jgi:hypothetical protein